MKTTRRKPGCAPHCWKLGPADGPVARERVRELENEHGKRRGWVWAKMERSPMAMALEHLAALAEQDGARRLNGGEPGGRGEELRGRRLRSGPHGCCTRWRRENRIRTGRRSKRRRGRCTLPWLRPAAELFQKLAAKTPFGGVGQQPLIEANVSECLLFADGLRYDLGQELRALCEERGLRVTLGRRWAGTPTVTATAKPAVSPVAGLLQGGATLPDNFTPSIKRQVAAPKGGQVEHGALPQTAGGSGLSVS